MTVLSECMGYLIRHLAEQIGDPGIAIVVVTVIVRLILLPLHKVQHEGMKQQTVKLSGCLISLLHLPLMLSLYHGIRLAIDSKTTTMLLPWVSSLLIRDQMLILPTITLCIQMLPQLFPYIRFFHSLHLQKAPVSMLVSMLVMNSIFVYAIPSGLGLYYFIQGLFSALEQFLYHLTDIQNGRAVVDVS